MPEFLEVSLISAEFFARHGYYAEEQVLGNRFVIDINARFLVKANIADDELANTLNYEQLYTIAAQQMKQTRQLLEPVARGIAYDILSQFPYIQYVSVRLKKLHPPLGGQVGASAVTVVIDNAV